MGELIMKKVLFAALLAAAPLCAQTYVIKNATVMTVSKGTFKGSILVKDGKIAEVGEKVMEPTGAKVIDAANQYVIPAIIHSPPHIPPPAAPPTASTPLSPTPHLPPSLTP